jgi:hypothetical protein
MERLAAKRLKSAPGMLYEDSISLSCRIFFARCLGTVQAAGRGAACKPNIVHAMPAFSSPAAFDWVTDRLPMAYRRDAVRKSRKRCDFMM